jgi:alpha-amylase
MVESSYRHPEAFTRTCCVTFSINYKTEYGQSVSLVGDHPKLGSWKDLSVGCMTWHEGNVWKLIVTGLDPNSHFQYKYVIIDTNKKTAIRWEEGRNRICDPAYLKDPADEISSASTFDEDSD